MPNQKNYKPPSDDGSARLRNAGSVLHVPGNVWNAQRTQDEMIQAMTRLDYTRESSLAHRARLDEAHQIMVTADVCRIKHMTGLKSPF